MTYVFSYDSMYILHSLLYHSAKENATKRRKIMDCTMKKLEEICLSSGSKDEKAQHLKQAFCLTNAQLNICRPILDTARLPLVHFVHIATYKDDVKYNTYTDIYEADAIATINEADLRNFSNLTFKLLSFYMASSPENYILFFDRDVNHASNAIHKTLNERIDPKYRRYVRHKYSDFQLLGLNYNVIFDNESNTCSGTMVYDYSGLLLI